MALTDTTPPGHLSAVEVRRQVEKALRAKARARVRRVLTSWPVVVTAAIVAGLIAAEVLR